MSGMRRVVAAVAFILLAYLGVNQLGPIGYALQDLQSQPANNGASPYSMFERCHPELFHIPAGGCQ